MDGIVLIILQQIINNYLLQQYHFYHMVRIKIKFINFKQMVQHVILLILQIIQI